MTDQTETLRAACIHGRYEKHSLEEVQGRIKHSLEEVQGRIMAMGYSCPGGRDITIDWQAAAIAVGELWKYNINKSPKQADEEWARLIVVAAIGDTE